MILHFGLYIGTSVYWLGCMLSISCVSSFVSAVSKDSRDHLRLKKYWAYSAHGSLTIRKANIFFKS